MKKVLLTVIVLLSVFVSFSCSVPFMPKMAEQLAPKTGNSLESVSYQVPVEHTIRDDEQNLIVYIAKNPLPLCQTVQPTFKLSPGARVFPMSPEYFNVFQASNPRLEIDADSFTFPDTHGQKFLKLISDAIEKGQKINFPPLPPTIISNQPQNYLQNGAYYYVVISENGTVESYMVKLLDPGTAGNSVLTANIPLDKNQGMIDNTVEFIIDEENALILGSTTGPARTLTPYFLLSPGATMKVNGMNYSPSSESPIDLSGNVSIEVTSENGYFTKNYTLRLVSGESECSLLEFFIPFEGNSSLQNTIRPNFTNDTTLTGETAYGVSRNDLISCISVSTGATVTVGGSPFVSGETKLDFSSPQTFRVTSADSSQYCDYTIHINEDRDNCLLLDYSFELMDNPGLTAKPKVHINEWTKTLYILMDDPWQNLNFRYQISPGASISDSLTSTTGTLSDSAGTVVITAADGTTANSYTVTLVSNVAAVPNPIFVTEDGTGTGERWSDPTNLEKALELAGSAFGSVKIYIKKGTYIPSSSFLIPADTELYGGFAGHESSESERSDIEGNKTVLSGDVNRDDTLSIGGFFRNIDDNRFIILRITSGNNIVISGLTVSGARGIGLYADNSENFLMEKVYLYRNCGNGAKIYNITKLEINDSTFSENYRGLTVSNCDSADIHRCKFIGNNGGGGLSGLESSSSLNAEDCLFENNKSFRYGGGVYLEGSASFVNCDFINNSAKMRGGALFFRAYSNPSSRITITGGAFINNKTTFNYSPTEGTTDSLEIFSGGGGAIYFDAFKENAFPNVFTLNNIRFSGNTTATYHPSKNLWAGNDICVNVYYGVAVPNILSSCHFEGSSVSERVVSISTVYHSPTLKYYTSWNIIVP